MSGVKLWLDDLRSAPDGWHHVTNIADAKIVMLAGNVDRVSLDHDLGACEKCLGGRTPEQWLAQTNFQSMPHCEHVGTGYLLVCWMEATKIWPRQKPEVHSANPAGAAKMRAAIEHSWRAPYHVR